MKIGEKFVGVDQARGKALASYVEVTRRPGNMIKTERILCVPSVQKELCPWPGQPVTKGWLEMHPIGTAGYDPAEQQAVAKAFWTWGNPRPSTPPRRKGRNQMKVTGQALRRTREREATG